MKLKILQKQKKENCRNEKYKIVVKTVSECWVYRNNNIEQQFQRNFV